DGEVRRKGRPRHRAAAAALAPGSRLRWRSRSRSPGPPARSGTQALAETLGRCCPAAGQGPEKSPYGEKVGHEIAAAASHGCVARQPRHAVEVGVVAGDLAQTVGLHDGYDEAVIGEQPQLLAERHAGGKESGSHEKNLKLALE